MHPTLGHRSFHVDIVNAQVCSECPSLFSLIGVLIMDGDIGDVSHRARMVVWSFEDVIYTMVELVCEREDCLLGM